MTLPIVAVLLIAAVAMVLFVTERLRMDLVAMLVLVGLVATGLLTPGQALSGFSNQATVTVAAMFVLAAGLQNTDALASVGRLLGRSRSPTAFLLTLFGLLAVVSPFVNNTAVVAVFLPIVIAASLRVGMPPTKALIPLSYVSQMIGVCTLIGTSTNLLVHSMAQDLGYRGFTMFEFLPLGAACALAGCAYLLTLGRWLLPSRGDTELESIQETGYYVTELRLTDASELIDASVASAGLAKDHGVYVLELWRDQARHWAPRAEVLRAGDILLVRGKWSQLVQLKNAYRLEFVLEPDPQDLEETEQPRDQRVMAEVMVSPVSIIIGHRLKALNRRLPPDTRVLGVQRRGTIVRAPLDEVQVEIGDVLLVLLPEARLPALRRNREFIVLSERDEPLARGWRTWFALGVMALVVAVAALGWMPIAVAAIAGALAMVLAGCLDADDLYESIDWRIVMLMAGLLPLGIAMSETGAAGFIVEHTIGWVSALGPHVVLAVLYLVALLLGELMSNSAAAVLLTPIGISTAQLMGTDATPFLIAVTFSASTSFLTPVGYQTNTMVYTAGGYRFTDFLKVGLPLNLIFWLIGVWLIPVFWPF